MKHLLRIIMLAGLWLLVAGFLQPVQAQTCNAPVVQLGNTRPTSITITWNSTAYPVGTTYEMGWRVGGSESAWVTQTGISTGWGAATNLTNNTLYELRVRALCTGGAISAYTTVQIATGCFGASPSNFRVNPQTDGAVVNWQMGFVSAGDAILYELQTQTYGSTTWSNPVTTTSRSINLTGLANSTYYTCRMRVLCENNINSNYVERFFQTLAACSPPTNRYADSQANTSVRLVSTAASGSTSINLRWRVFSTPAPAWNTVANISTVYSLTGLTIDTPYEWQLQTVCAGGVTSDYSASETFRTTNVVCNAPTSVSVVGLTNTSARFFLPNNSDYYDFRWREAGSTTAWNTVSVYHFSSPWEMTQLSLNTTYEWQVRQRCGNNVSDYTPLATFQTTAPPCPVETPSIYGSGTDRYQSVSWSYGGDVRYNLRWRVMGTQNWLAEVPVPGSSGINYLITGLSASTAYEWQVQTNCYQTGGLSVYSASGNFTTTTQQPCLAPVVVANTNTLTVSDRRASLLWSDGGYLNASQYEGQYRAVGATAWTPFSSTGLYGSTVTLTGLSASTTYELQVRSVCSPGYSSTLTAPVTFSTLAPIVCANLTPTSLTNSDITRSNVRFSWADMVPGTTVETYNLRYRPIGTTTWFGNVTNWTVNTYPPFSQNLTPGATYEWQVQTVCPEGDLSPWSALAQVSTVLCESLTEPSTLVYLENQARLGWSGQVGSTTYPVTVQYRQKVPQGSFITLNNFSNGNRLTGLVAGVAYEWQARNNCSSPTSVSDWTPLQSFTAIGCVPPPYANVLDGGFSNGVAFTYIGWRRGFPFDNQTFNTRWRKVGTATWLTANNLTDNGFGQFIGNLESNAAFEWQVQTNCTGGGQSAFSASYIFSTIPGFFPQGNYYTVKAGDWTDYSVWSTGRVPEFSPVGNATPVEIRHRVTIPVGVLAPARKITYTNGGSLVLSTGARVVLGN